MIPTFHFLPWCLAAVVLFADPICASSVIEGVVHFPEERKRRRTAARYAVKTAKSPAEEPKKQAVVYLEGDFSERGETQSGVTTVLQKDLRFKPNVVPVQVGTRIEFPNRDDEYHNVLSFSSAKSFDLGRFLPGESPPSVLFDEPGVVEINCEIHEHMRGHILVLETPHFTVTDEEGKGTFRLENIPPGRHRVKAWIDRRTVWEVEVECREGETSIVEFTDPGRKR